jgi:hypothetical protein
MNTLRSEKPSTDAGFRTSRRNPFWISFVRRSSTLKRFIKNNPLLINLNFSDRLSRLVATSQVSIIVVESSLIGPVY